ncbi:WD40 repeat domain-containing protein [Streptomyces sp. H27-H1]|uniref:WD40 repeat domain-containing protein n=1 Tax=Streptomyces sp. H27-H1 TaxID=2996461 RepID=UPI002270FFD7|nr:WD40 repeat domain-containing protein [Streptomyces sp. H27-H1]MCY0927384.1 WD40 repeat domain-containing protein [Streptomyces sp. H27-H1]
MRPHPLPLTAAVVTAVAAAVGAGLALPPVAAYAAPGPAASGFTITDPRIKESSGLAASRIHPGVYWTHNDSDDGPYVYGVDSATGKTVARITMTGIGSPRDIEGISLGPDGQLYVGDIGDNRGGSWDHVWIYRFPEPKKLGNATLKAAQFTVKYADGPRNAEALMVHPVTGRVYIASKDEREGGLYEGPATLTTSGTNTFRRIGDVPWVTDGAFSPDGGRLALRGYLWARTYPWKDGRPAGDGESVAAPWQGQAESVTYTADGSALMFGAEGANSRVVAVAVGPATDPGPSGPSGSPSRAPSGSAAPGAGSSAGPSDGNFTKGAFVLVAAMGLTLAAKRILRRRPNP